MAAGEGAAAAEVKPADEGGDAAEEATPKEAGADTLQKEEADTGTAPLLTPKQYL